ncbi:uncharacterized protein A1O5_06535 [Cladophialophora psammophila CBS 110553]|uniref:MYND-type domain-containing protein n=1 Tax=Cladophialophora psammophila CBS 110553 TaxID=1182543 RepID=W9X0M1_9EURO|nr:uncharacterized protein A1O5_06535 [Cladophialophora psammophila CBS 110553]EXJ70466.1 hypothetical protein A1O5_06535 [Cladophialophora psammophila CBS 110553]
METVAAIPLACANWTPDGNTCVNNGKLACGGCRLLAYCGKACQKNHWPEHKKVCKSSLNRPGWRPRWELDGREAAFASGDASRNLHNPYGGGKYLWGNVPAIDILRLEQNEGHNYNKDLALLFAASGDLRNVVKTIGSLPNQYPGRVQVCINDRELHVVMRNATLLLLALTSQDSRSTGSAAEPCALTETLIHVWYSALLPPKVSSELQIRVKPLIDEVCRGIAHKPADSLLGKTWRFPSGSSLRLVLKKEDWLLFQSFVDMPKGLTEDQARKIRVAVTLAPERADYRDRWYFKDETPSMRIAKQRFREDGLLLPFGHPRHEFRIPNPMFFQSSQGWPMDDQANPLSGWPVWELRRTSWTASQDAYGKLFVYLGVVLGKFLLFLDAGTTDFELYICDVTALPHHLGLNRYDRIEVANISDAGYVGTRGVLATLVPLLRSLKQNPHAVLITLYLNAVMEVIKTGPKKDQVPDVGLLTQYLPGLRLFPPPTNNSAEMLRLWDARTLALDVDKFFERYMNIHQFREMEISRDLEVEMKANTVTESWPTQLKLQPGQDGAQEEFDVLLGSSLTGLEHYVEWKRAR